jgi:hypothetical protein
MKPSLLSRQWVLVIAFAAVGAIATLPLALDTLRTDAKAAEPKTLGKVTLTCFDNEMRPHECLVGAPPRLASK